MNGRSAGWGLVLFLFTLSLTRLFPQNEPDSSPHSVHFVEVEKNVKLEVLDWGGTGRPLIFLAGLGNTAHIFDTLAPRFTEKHHVYGITRRGFGVSSKPAAEVANYTADRLGDDVLAVMAALKVNRPVLIGHSIAGEELSSIGSRYPDRIAGLIYLDAVNGYSFYSPEEGDYILDMLDLRREIEQLKAGATFDPQFGRDMLATTTRLQKDLEAVVREGSLIPPSPQRPPNPISVAIRFGQQKYSAINVPILAIFACPHNFDRMFKNDPAGKAAMAANDKTMCSTRANTFAASVHTAKVVQLPDASHYVFESNEADVTKEMDAFLTPLP